MKKYFSLLLCCLIFFSFSGCQIRQHEQITIKFDYPFYLNLSEMASKSDLVIHGKITGSKFQMLDVGMDANSDDPKRNPGGKTDHTKLPYTIYNVEISEVFKGKAKVGDTVQLKQLVGDNGEKQYVFAEAQPLDAKSDYIFFLSAYSNSPASLVNPVQGVYTVSGGKIIANEKNPIKINGFQELKNLKK